MSEIKDSVENVLDTVQDIVETQKDLMVVKFLQQFSNTASVAVIGMFCLLMLLLVLLFAGIGFSWWIGEKMNDMKLGFFIVGGVYTIALLFLAFLSKKTLLPIIRNLIIDKIYDED